MEDDRFVTADRIWNGLPNDVRHELLLLNTGISEFYQTPSELARTAIPEAVKAISVVVGQENLEKYIESKRNPQ